MPIDFNKTAARKLQLPALNLQARPDAGNGNEVHSPQIRVGLG